MTLPSVGKDVDIKVVSGRVDLGKVAGRASVSGTSGAIEIDQAVPCGLIVNELASNSLKHGFPEGRSGHVSIGLRLAGKGASITLSVSDNGVGLPKDFDLQKTHSLGLQLVSDLARQLQGSLSIGPGPGAAFEVTFTRNRTPTGEIPRTQGVGPALSMAPEGE